ncbi:MAG: ADP-ribosylglycohydrolase family protein [Anaerolineae bacterium]|nr:ADP-ribosylglycohydrolase family protein [Anaerolineae bacterium]
MVESPRVTIREVAEKAGVSPASVSLTLSGRGRIADDTRQHILETVAKLNYVLPKRKREPSDLRVFTVAAGTGSEYHPARTINLERQVTFLTDELDQRQQEGYDISDVEASLRALSQGSPTQYDIEVGWKKLENLELRPDYPFQEPSNWSDITAARAEPSKLDARFSANQLHDRIYGGLLGRAIGCTLGRPLELLGDFEDIQEFLERGDAYPLNNYVPEILPHPPGYAHYEPEVQKYFRGQVRYAPRDDDLDYSVLNLTILERCGLNFTSEQVAETWLHRLSYNAIYTAERMAYGNLVNQFGPPDSAGYRNPYREFIGAQIRADMFGYTAPGKPDLAAQRAWRDARISHVKNGIYGEMFVSAAIAAAFVVTDVEAVIRAGLEVIPQQSRMAFTIRDTIDQTRRSQNWQDVAAYITERFAEHDPTHVLPNVSLLVMALLWGNCDFERSVTTAAMAGFDSDCNAATTGSIVGILNGAANLPGKWTLPINDQLESWVWGHSMVRISDLAQRVYVLARESLTNSANT